MFYADAISDRYMYSTDNNEYAMGLNDENEWDENIMDYETPLDEQIDDYVEGDGDGSMLYNETGFDKERLG